MNKIVNVKKTRKYLHGKLRGYHRSNQILALLMFICIFPFLAVVAIAIVMELFLVDRCIQSPFFLEGRFTAGRPFDIFKFRTTNSTGKLSRIGFLLRKFYLDELPQLFNILRGEMVFVGPRPNPPTEYDLIKRAGYFSKVVQKAGLTGGVQSVKGTVHHGDLRLDEAYLHFCIENSVGEIIKHDLQIMWKTLGVIFRAEGI